MAERTNLRPIGVIENMSWFVCPHCGERDAIFGEGGGAEAAETLGVPLMAQVPLRARAARGRRHGRADRAVAIPTRPRAWRSARPPTRVRQATKSKVGKPLTADDEPVSLRRTGPSRRQSGPAEAPSTSKPASSSAATAASNRRTST